MADNEKKTVITYTTGAAMAKKFEIWAGPGWIKLSTEAGYGEFKIDGKLQSKNAIPGKTWVYDVEPKTHMVSVYMGGQTIFEGIADASANAEIKQVFAIDQPAKEPPREEGTDQPAGEPAPKQPEPADPAPEQPEPEHPAESAQVPDDQPAGQPETPPSIPAPDDNAFVLVSREGLEQLAQELRDLSDMLCGWLGFQ